MASDLDRGWDADGGGADDPADWLASDAAAWLAAADRRVVGVAVGGFDMITPAEGSHCRQGGEGWRARWPW